MNAYSARNRGDGMIVSQMVRLFRPQGCEVRLIRMTRDDGRYGIPRVPPLTPGGRTQTAPVSAAGRGLSALRAWLVGRDPSGSLDWCDVCVSAGGGYLYDDGGNASPLNLVRRLAILRAARRSDTPVVLFSQSIGPFASVMAIARRARAPARHPRHRTRADLVGALRPHWRRESRAVRRRRVRIGAERRARERFASWVNRRDRDERTSRCARQRLSALQTRPGRGTGWKRSCSTVTRRRHLPGLGSRRRRRCHRRA